METEDMDKLEQRQLGALEALLLLAASPVPLERLAAAIGESQGRTDALLRTLQADYAGKLEGSRERGFELREAGGGWRMYTNPHFREIVTAYVVSEQSGKLSVPALETLAVIAYRQPVSRAQIAAIRGVNVDSVVRTLLARGLIEEVGASVTGAGMYGTTDRFLEAMGMNSLAELAPLAPYLPEESEIDEVAKEIE